MTGQIVCNITPAEITTCGLSPFKGVKQNKRTPTALETNSLNFANHVHLLTNITTEKFSNSRAATICQIQPPSQEPQMQPLLWSLLQVKSFLF